MPALTLTDKGTLRLRCSYDDRGIAKAIPGRRWNNADKCWEFSATEDAYNQIKASFPDLRVGEPVTAFFAEIRRRNEQASKLKQNGWADAQPLEPMPIRTQAYGHQILAYNLGLTLPNVAFLMEQGTGKTLAGLAVASRRFVRREVFRLLVVCPAAALAAWPRQFNQHGAIPFEARGITGTPAKKEELLRGWRRDSLTLQVAVITYDSAWRIIDWLLEWQPDMVICDESHRIKTPGAKQSKAAHRLSVAPYKMILTGTPIAKNAFDFYSQYKFLDPSILGTNQTALRARYGITEADLIRRQALTDGAQIGLDGLAAGVHVSPWADKKWTLHPDRESEYLQRVHSIAFVVKKSELDELGLPERMEPPHFPPTICQLEPAARKLYNKLKYDSVAELESGAEIIADNVLARMTRLSQLCGGYLPGEDGQPEQVSRAKMDVLEDLIENITYQEEKAVIFCHYLPEITGIQEMLTRMGIGYVRNDGSVPVAKRGELEDRFQSDPRIQVFLGQTAASRESLTLTAARYCILYSYDYRYLDYAQVKDRIHRIGQKRTCFFYHLVCENTVDEKVVETLMERKNIADVCLDWRRFLC